MGTERHVSELLPDYVLGCIDEEDLDRVSQHLKTCRNCQDELHAYESVVGQLALMCNLEPRPELKNRLMADIQQRQAAKDKNPQPWWRSIPGSLGLTGGALAWRLAVVVLVLGLVAGNVWQWQRSQARPGQFDWIHMAHTSAAPDAMGMLVLSADGQYGALIVDRLPALDAAHQYQLWLVEAGQRVSGAVFSVNPEGYGALTVRTPLPLSKYESCGITVEPAGGSQAPTGEKVLSATL